jgi:hypothetical protein
MIFAKGAALIDPARSDQTPCNDETLCPIHSASFRRKNAEWVGNHGLILNGWISILLFIFAIAGVQARAQNQTPANVALVGWTDPDTGLMWTKSDNGSDMNWYQANAYCSNLRLGGFSDWRLPTINELQAVFDPGIMKGYIKRSGWPWSSTKKNDGYGWFLNGGTEDDGMLLSTSNGGRALCVRR